LSAPVFVVPGLAANTLVLPLGYGRPHGGRVARGAGFNAYALRPVSLDGPAGGAVVRADAALPGWIPGGTIARTGGRRRLATTQDHHIVDTIGLKGLAERVPVLVREGTLSEYRERPDFAQHLGAEHPPLVSLWKEWEYQGHKWGMAIDLTACIGCSACVVACTAENNVPVVGKQRVEEGREMHWLRVDRYFRGPAEEPAVAFQPMACVHCENAPCEQVCPVAATVHDAEGLNVMVYNRCIGTRYCSNNCPWKVRRFNFFNYRKNYTPTQKMVMNPEVTVRSRGVMEKCTYCLQRIESARITAKNENRALRDGDVTPACAQTCPTQAIVFGDLNDPQSRAAKLHRSPRAYSTLAELNTKARTAYLARLRNPGGPEGVPGGFAPASPGHHGAPGGHGAPGEHGAPGGNGAPGDHGAPDEHGGRHDG